MFVEAYEKLTNADKENFQRIVSLLLSKTFLVGRIYDKTKKLFRFNSDYLFVQKNVELFCEYFEIGGFRLIRENYYEVIYIENEFGYCKKRLDKNTTIFLYGLRLKFDEEREKVNLNTNVIVSVADIVRTLTDVGAYSKKPADVEIRSALSTLINFNIIQKLEGELEKPDTKIIILPSILFVVTNEKITNLSEIVGTIDKQNEEEKEIGEEE